MSAFQHGFVPLAGNEPEPALRPCDHPGCTAAGHHRAPRAPDALTNYYWFCLEHVRAYNARWNFFEGMSEAEIEAFRHADVTGHRPTWRFGVEAAYARLWAAEQLQDLFGLFGRADGANGSAERSQAPPGNEREALAAMNLGYGAGLAEIKNRFKDLVKRHHPDATGGDKGSEERLRVIIEAYRLLVRRRRSS